METTIKEIAAILRSTEEMADQFAQRVQERAGQPVSHEEILGAMEKISAKTLSLEKVVAKVQEQQKRKGRRASRRRKAPETRRRVAKSTGGADGVMATRRPSVSAKKARTVLERLEAILKENWDRAEKEGLQPKRTSVEEFVNAVYGHTDRREATRRRILQAASQLDQADVLLTPALVADIVHQLIEG